MAISTMEILMLLNAQYTGQSVFGMVRRDVQGAQQAFSAFGTSLKDTTKLAQDAAMAQNKLNLASKELATWQGLVTTGTKLGSTEMKAYTQVVIDHEAAQRAATTATRDLQTAMGGAGAAAGEMGGMLAGLGTAAAVGGIVALAVAIKSAVSDANAFADKLTYVQANAHATAAAMATISQASLNLGASGSVPFNATQLAGSTFVPLSAGIPVPVVSATMATAAKVGEIQGVSDLTPIAQAASAMQRTFGGGGARATTASMNRWYDMLTRAEQLAGVTQAGQVTQAVGRFAGTSMVAGIGPAAALSFVEQLTHAGVSGRQAAMWTTGAEQQLFLKPNQKQLDAAKALGVTLGPQALQQYGGFYGALAAYRTAVTGTSGQMDPRALAKLLGGANVVKAFGIVGGGPGGFGSAASDMAQIANPAGTVQAAYQQRQKSPVEQWAEVQTRFTTDLTHLGLVLTNNTQPALLNLARNSLAASEGIGSMMGSLGNFLNKLGVNPGSSGNPIDWLQGKLDRVFPTVGGALSHSPVAHALGASFGSGSSSSGAPSTLMESLVAGYLAASPTRQQQLRAQYPQYPALLNQYFPNASMTSPVGGAANMAPGASIPRTSLPPGLSSAATENRRLQVFGDAMAANARQARLDALDSPASAAKKARLTGKVGPELIRQAGTDYYDRYALFNEARAAYGSSAVRLTGGSQQQDAIQHLRQLLQKADTQIQQMSDLIRAIVLGNTLSKQQISLEQTLVGAVTRPQPSTVTNPPRRLLGAAVR